MRRDVRALISHIHCVLGHYSRTSLDARASLQYGRSLMCLADHSAYHSGDLTAAAKHAERALSILQTHLGAVSVQLPLLRLASYCERAGRYTEAVRLAERQLAIFKTALGVSSPLLLHVLQVIAAAHGGLGQFARQKAVLERALTIVRAQPPADGEAEMASLLNELAIDIVARKL
jgi:tetratricopeptide (TPR) repeat protein